ncbi:probable 6-phosphofructokinase subunit alpha [Saccharomycodes ludwigii]|uniref:ATP-dependent 6-phosphofructokinase n=1 Tax=Saccharomycodes ludwigii TaxID=36035 RepID=A0A376B6M1_9ASCO|nr:hypothetical protein SCDLUD_004547 [Saccharomycodes ludwigii]KAH3899121.1 hypothetical protein SCDLUD_004547 [Saccharomycodes ludwigii]SSD60292.1 probable 6-phosphofructokinase subunit alpha [Saccharomycodes ludwigii]
MSSADTPINVVDDTISYSNTSEDLVYGLAFRSVATHDPHLYHETIKFYHKLGFSTIKVYDKFKNGQNLLLSNGTSKDSLKETWLESFKLSELDKDGFRIPQQEAKLGHKSDGALLKIRLISIEASKSINVNTSSISYFSAALEKQASLLSALPKSKKISNDLYEVVDPLDNVVYLTNSVNGVTNEKLSEDYFLHPNVPSPSSSGSSEDVKQAASVLLNKNAPKKKKIAVMTSGGDSPGMNASVRAVVRAGIYYGCDVYAVYEGYKGLLEGGSLLKKMEWSDVRGYLSEGGTLIGTARCMEFRERWGRKQAAKNLITEGIDALVVCGGDGSLTGADLFRHEWPSLLEELVSDKVFTEQDIEPYKHLNIVGLVGSIDNDMSGTDSTIGAFSALERIIEMVDYIDETAKSHSRAFVVEVMGRHCGWLALMAGIATGADYIFIPERAPKCGEWQKELKEVCQRHRDKGRRNNTVIVAEGAIDDQLNPITSENVKDVLVEMGLDTRVTILGHVQRGGTAVAHDRWLGTMQGVEAVKAILEMTPETPSPLIGIRENKIITMPLVESVKLTKEVASSIDNKDFDKAISLRDSEFIELYEDFIATTVKDGDSQLLPENERLNIAVVHVGAPTAALNAATRAATLYCLTKGHTVYGILNGFSGLITTGDVTELKWEDVENWHNLGGSELGTNRSTPSEDLGTVAYHFQKNKFDGCIIIGGFEGYVSLKQLHDARTNYPIFNIPIVLIPSTISNNVPGTEYSLGTDTCLNALVNYTDTVKQSASATRKRAFVVEVQGGHSGYIASYTGLVSGAVSVYTPEKKLNLSYIEEDIKLLKENFKHDQGENKSGKILIRNELASKVYTTELIGDIIDENSGGVFGVRTAIPGHVQQGGKPSSKDRIVSARFAIKCVKFIEECNRSANKAAAGEVTDSQILRFHYTNKGVKIYNVENEDGTAAVISVNGSHVTFKPISIVWDKETNVELRKGDVIHWEEFNTIGDILSGRLMLRKELDAESS